MIDVIMGYEACRNAHKISHWTNDGADAWENYWHARMAQYFNVNITPTQNFTDFYSESLRGVNPDEFAGITDTSSVGRDLLGTSTDVSLYYTMSVTRTDAFDVAMPTALGGEVTYTGTRISSGQIVPTAADAHDSSKAGISGISISTSSASSSTSSITTSSDDDIDMARTVDSCYPHNATGHLDFNAPCNQQDTILAQCSYGSLALKILTLPFPSGTWPEFSPRLQKQSPETERTCLCQSQLIDVSVGCVRCTESHQLYPQAEKVEESIHASMQQYCDADYPITQSFSEFVHEFADDFYSDSNVSLGSYTAEAIGTSTDVSLYYTLSVTRSDAYDIAMPTPAKSDGNIVYTSTRIEDGQIVPTARSVKDPGSSEGAAATSTHAGSAGLFVIAALAAIGL